MRLPPLAAVFLLPVFVFGQTPPAAPPPAATPAEELTVAPGFKAELLKSATKEDGSWICLGLDAKGRLYISPQGKVEGAGFKNDDLWGGLWRVTLDAQGHIAQWDKVPVPIGDAMGMLWAFDSLYVSGDGPEGRGIYRLKDSKGADELDSWTLFKKIPGGTGEHGAHALVLGPDGKSIYIVHGNATPLIEGTDPESPFRNYAEDDLLPRVKDPVATFFDKVKSPYGYILKTDENGNKWELVAGGLRNPYAIAFNADGELFTYDSDMEWDVSLPWYRPTRVLHIVPGGEYGFREGSAKWPDYYADSLPAVVNIGLGCPTGVTFGTASNFPAKYKSAFFILDWTFGRILAIHMHPKGASYVAQNSLPSPYHLTGPAKSDDVEEFVRGKGMPVTAVQFGKDGAMYFTTGGRGTQAGLYRVSYTGPAESGPAPAPTPEELAAKGARAMRAEFEGTVAPSAHPDVFAQFELKVHAALDYDRFIYFAARTRAEQLPLDQLRNLALEDPQVGDPPQNGFLVLKPTITFGGFGRSDKNEARVRALDGLMGLLTLARMGTKDDQELVLKALGKYPLDSLDEDLKLVKLRVIEVALARQGRPNSDLVQMGIAKLSRQFPAKSFALNRELCALLVYLGAPDVVEKTLALMDKAEEPVEQIWYALCLREAGPWTPAQREHYFSWFAKMQDYHGGNSARKFLLRIRDQALEKLPEAERPPLLALAEKVMGKPNTGPIMPARPFVKMWTVADLDPVLSGVNKGRDFARGKKLFGEVLCAQCHLFAGGGGLAKGGAIGPDLTAVGSRFNAHDILESIIDPSKVISDQYASFLFTMKDGSVFSGQVADENHYLVTLIIDPFNGTRQNIPKGNIVKREASPVSLMPPGLLSTLTQDEVLDLLAYLQSAGNEQSPTFAK